MVEASPEQELEQIGDRGIHESQERKIGEMNEEQDKGKSDERKKCPARRPALQGICDKDERPDFQEGLPQGIKEEKEAYPP